MGDYAMKSFKKGNKYNYIFLRSLGDYAMKSFEKGNKYNYILLRSYGRLCIEII
jgi:hypothetical protein